MKFLQDGVVPEGTIFNRIITTFGALWVIIFVTKLSGSMLGAWYGLNSLLYVLSVFTFYSLLERVFRRQSTAILGTLFFAGSYAMLRFGLNYLMDIGGWAFYVFSLYFTLSYVQEQRKRDLWLAAILSGIGGLFKEYAFLATIPIAAVLIYENRRSLSGLFRYSIGPAVVTLLPIALVYLYVYKSFGYTYADWLGANQTYYIYNSRVLEYIKSFGSLLNILGLLFVAGVWALNKKWVNIEMRIKVFIIGLFLSFLPVFLWPAITQRILFITIPFVVLVSSYFIDRYPRHWLIFGGILLLYILINFYMDSVVLQVINLPF